MAAGESRPGESLPRSQRLSKREDFQRCYRKGRRVHGAYLTLYFLDSRSGQARLGMTVSRKVGKAVVRVKLKRRFREIYRRWPQRDDLPPLDLVVHAKPSSATASFRDLQLDLNRSLSRARERDGRARRPGRP